MTTISYDHLSDLAAKHGLQLCGVSSAAPFTQDAAWLEAWQGNGFAGEMRYMQRDAMRQASPLALFPEARSIACFAIHYSYEPRPERKQGYGRVARYAWGSDYHLEIPKRLAALVEELQRQRGASISYKIFTDAVPLLERAAAHRAGLGFIGKNSMLIQRGIGSYFFLGEILWELEVSNPEAAANPKLAVLNSHCGTCQSCISRCPTGAIVGERVVDARRCISYLTIEKRGALSWEEREMLGEWVFGCDECQEVCPFNHSGLKQGAESSWREFEAEAGVGALLSLNQVLAIRGDEEFRRRFAGTALLRPKREGLVRNSAVVAANTGSIESLEALRGCVLEDSSSVVRQHALWALYKLSCQGGARERASFMAVFDRFRDSEESRDAALAEEVRALKNLI